MAKATEIVVGGTEEELALLQQQGGGAESSNVYFPTLKLQHTTDFNGDPNELRGHYTLTEKGELGDWVTTDLGVEVDVQFLVRRYRLYLKKGDTTYQSRYEFDSLSDTVTLTQQVGEGDNQKYSIAGAGDVRSLQAQFLVDTEYGQRSELKLLSVLYVKLGDKICKWKTNMSATMAYSQYSKTVMPFGVITKCTVEEKKNGAVKYYAPVLVATSKITDVADALATQKGLRGVFDLQNGYAANAVGESLPSLPEAPFSIEPDGVTSDTLEKIPF